MAQEQQQGADAEDHGQGDGDYAIPHPMSILANEPEEEHIDRAYHRAQANNRQKKVNHTVTSGFRSVFGMKVLIKPIPQLNEPGLDGCMLTPAQF
jgi:hypothetical protein